MRKSNPFAMGVAAALAVVFLLAAPARAAIFTGGPSVRVIPNDEFEIRWIADFVGTGKVELFTNSDGTGLIDVGGTPQALDHTAVFIVGGVVTPDSTYYFKVTHTDPTGARADLTNEPPPFPPVFTGVQAIGNVLVEPDFDSALISWEANVIGFGQVDFGLTTPGDLGTVSDSQNVTDHMIELTGLLPGTTYQFRVSNRHAIDGDALAEQTGFFTTLASPNVVPEPSTITVWMGLALVGWRVHSRTSRMARKKPSRENG